MSDKTLPRIIAAGLVKKDKKYLLTKEVFKDGEKYWIVPGGKVEFGETISQAVIREIAEEVGLLSEIDRFLNFKEAVFPPYYHTIIFFYLLKYKSGELKIAEDEGVLEANYFTKEEALTLNLADSARWLFENHI